MSESYFYRIFIILWPHIYILLFSLNAILSAFFPLVIFFVIIIFGCNFNLRRWKQIMFHVFCNKSQSSPSACHIDHFYPHPGISFLHLLWSDSSHNFLEKHEGSWEHSTCVLKSCCSDEVILRLSFTGRAWSIALHLLTVTQLWGVRYLNCLCFSPTKPRNIGGVH